MSTKWTFAFQEGSLNKIVDEEEDKYLRSALESPEPRVIIYICADEKEYFINLNHVQVVLRETIEDKIPEIEDKEQS